MRFWTSLKRQHAVTASQLLGHPSRRVGRNRRRIDGGDRQVESRGKHRHPLRLGDDATGHPQRLARALTGLLGLPGHHDGRFHIPDFGLGE